MRYLKHILLVLVVILGIAVYLNYPKLNIINGYAAKYMASSVFVGNRTEASILANDLDMPLIKLASTSYNATKGEAMATLYGFLGRKAIDRKGLGTVLINADHPEGELYLQPERNHATIDLPYPFGHLPPKDSLFPEIDYKKLELAAKLAFAQPEVQKTRTFLILYKGHLLYEKYTEGFDKNTPILGWSMTKSLLATCYGILEYQGKLSMDMPAPIAEWKNDGRKDITLNHLLRMQSGLAWDEDYSKISDVTKMLFLDADMTRAQRFKKAVAQPTEIWNYSSGTTNLLSGVLREQFDTAEEYLNFPYAAFLDKIGAYSMLLEADLKGNYVGSSYAWANTRDWARVGQLYLDKGHWNGEQLFNVDWVNYITTPTQGSDKVYGAHFWLNAGGKYPKVPKDLYSLNGFQGQYVFIIPSKDLVVVRTGLAEYPEFDVDAVLAAVIAAIE